MNLLQKASQWLGVFTGDPWVSRQDGDNFRTNQVTLAAYDDVMSYGNAGLMGLSAVYACRRLISGTISSLPAMVYRTGDDGARSIARDLTLYRIIHDSPNADQTAADFWGFISDSLEFYGNGYAEIVRRNGGEIVALNPIPPDLVKVSRLNNGALGYEWTSGGNRYRLPQDQMLHIRGDGGGPMGGASPLSICRATLGASMAVERAASNMFGNGVRPSGIMSTDKTMTPEQRTRAEELLQAKFTGAMNVGRPMLLDNGVKWEQLTINPEDAQMLESRRFSVEEICRIFGVPPHLIGHTENSTSWGTGLEQQTLGFQKFSLGPRLNRIEQALEKQLLTAVERQQGVTIEFNLEGLLRADSAARAQFNQTMLQNGVYTINEVRAQDNLPPVEGGDVPRMQSQNVPITAAGSVAREDVAKLAALVKAAAIDGVRASAAGGDRPV